jgi:crossover junction endodeoxyribonuclease RuvC
MKVLGIDPGTAALGYGIVERTAGRLREVDHGCLVTSPDLSMPERLLQIHALVDELLHLHRPDLMGVERLFFSRNVQTALGVGQARGVVLLAAAQHETPVREATPNEVKSAIAGYGPPTRIVVRSRPLPRCGIAPPWHRSPAARPAMSARSARPSPVSATPSAAPPSP